MKALKLSPYVSPDVLHILLMTSFLNEKFDFTKFFWNFFIYNLKKILAQSQKHANVFALIWLSLLWDSSCYVAYLLHLNWVNDIICSKFTFLGIMTSLINFLKTILFCSIKMFSTNVQCNMKNSVREKHIQNRVKHLRYRFL